MAAANFLLLSDGSPLLLSGEAASALLLGGEPPPLVPVSAGADSRVSLRVVAAYRPR